MEAHRDDELQGKSVEDLCLSCPFCDVPQIIYTGKLVHFDTLSVRCYDEIWR